MRKYRLVRENMNVTDLPDEIIELICSYISPVQLCLSRWNMVSKGFSDMLRQIYANLHELNTITGQDSKFFEQFCLPEANENKVILQYIIKFNPILLMRKLRFLHISLGDNYGTLNCNHILCDFALARKFTDKLKFVDLSVTLSSEKEKYITCYNFQRLIRFLMEMTGNTAGTWSLCLKDKTKRAQGWFCPSELSSYRAISFIAYVRTILEMGISLHTLELVDELKMSPYMIVMKRRRRFLYMYDEYKQCKNLIIRYDVGIVAPMLPNVDEKYCRLQQVEVIASHVLYKDDFLKYLSLAPNVKILRILLPCHWTERMKRCTFGCFRNTDFACFMEYGWSSLSSYLPHAKLVFS
ncbi:hypothetical protein DINM_007276 [Dirofilaria immitis]|nr:hypothetical protein [Dirofilaria immitis]